jgi:hypothetical protein
MRVLLVGEGARLEELSAALRAEGVSVERVPRDPGGEPVEEIADIAAAVRTFERLLTEDEPDAVVLGSTSNAALAAILVATKLGVPVARLDSAGGGLGGTGINRAVIEQLADAELAADATAIAAWTRH